MRRTLHELWNWRLFDRVAEALRARRSASTGRRIASSSAAPTYTAYVLDPARRCSPTPPTASTTSTGWATTATATRSPSAGRSTGTHRGPGPYGPPTGRRVHHWGLTHLRDPRRRRSSRSGPVSERVRTCLQQIHRASGGDAPDGDARRTSRSASPPSPAPTSCSSADQGERKHPMRGFDDTYVDIVDYIDPGDPSHLGREGHRATSTTRIATTAAGHRRLRPAVRARQDRRRYGPHHQRLPRRAALRRRGDLGGRRRPRVRDVAPDSDRRPQHGLLQVRPADRAQGRRAGRSPTAPRGRTRSTRSGCSTTTRACCASSASTCARSPATWATRAHLDPLGDARFGEAERRSARASRSASRAAGDGFDPEDFVRRVWHDTWNWRNLSTIDRAYAPNVRWLGPTDRRLQGRGDLKSFVLSMLADVSRSGAVRRRRLLDGQRGGRLPRLAPLVRARDPSRPRRLRRADRAPGGALGHLAAPHRARAGSRRSGRCSTSSRSCSRSCATSPSRARRDASRRASRAARR